MTIGNDFDQLEASDYPQSNDAIEMMFLCKWNHNLLWIILDAVSITGIVILSSIISRR